MVIFEGKYLNHEWTVGEISGTLYGMSGKGWTDQELFLYWPRHFLKYANPERSLLLLLDGHSPHFSIELAEEQNVINFCLPLLTTYRSQSLDSGVFGPLKKPWTEVCNSYKQDNPKAAITKYSFTPLFAKAWSQSFIPNNLIYGFKKCRIHPFNSEAIEILDDGATAMLQVSAADEQLHTSHENSVCQDQHFEYQKSQ